MVSNSFKPYNKEITKFLHCWHFARGSQRWPVDSPHKSSEMGKRFACHVVMVGDHRRQVEYIQSYWWIICKRQLSRLWINKWRHNGRDSDSNHQPHGCLLNRLFSRRSRKTSRLCVTGLCVGNSPGTGEFTAQMASNAENVSIWWRHQNSNLLFNATGLETWISECSIQAIICQFVSEILKRSSLYRLRVNIDKQV